MQVKTVNIDASDFDGSLENCEWPESVMEVIEGELERMRQDPGGENSEIRIVISNDFEPEEEDEESEDETENQKEG